MALAADHAAPAQRGAAMGTYTMAFDLGIGLGAFLWRMVFGYAGFRPMFAFSAVMCVVGMIVLAAGSGMGRKKIDACASPAP
jgi:predicted MFS family arabinose efflux permease